MLEGKTKEEAAREILDSVSEYYLRFPRRAAGT